MVAGRRGGGERYHVLQLTVFSLVTGEPQCVQQERGMIGYVLVTEEYTGVEAASPAALHGPSYTGRAGWMIWGLRAPQKSRLKTKHTSLTGPPSLVFSSRKFLQVLSGIMGIH